MEIALKEVGNTFNPIQLTFLRFLIGSIILLPLAIKKLKTRGHGLNKKDIVFFAITGFICVVVSMSFFQLAVSYSKASTVAILFSCNPVFVVPLACFLLKEKITKGTILTLTLNIIGIILIVNPVNMSSIFGIIFSLLAAATFAVYSVVGQSGSQKHGYDAIVLNSFSFLLGSFEMFLLILASKIHIVSSGFISMGMEDFANIPVFKGITLEHLPALLFIGIMVTGLGYTFYFSAMEVTSANKASIVFYIKPVLSPILAFLTIHEDILSNVRFGIILIMIGSSVTLISKREKQTGAGAELLTSHFKRSA
jgi:drug/metabolite transporter (DMT)-like permease